MPMTDEQKTAVSVDLRVMRRIATAFEQLSEPGRTFVLASLTAHHKGEELTSTLADMPAEEKLRVITEMGFTRSGSDHTEDCPYARDPGFICNCVPPAPVWHAPDDVLEHLGETWEQRLEKAKKPRPIPAVER